jgi:autotransporter-associated beta strand protein
LQLGNNVNISNNLDIGEANNTKQILVSGSANATLSGNIQIDETDLTQFQLQVNAGSTLTLNTSSVMSGVGGFIRSTGAGQLIIDSANTYSGGTTLNIGNTVLSNTSGSALGSGNVNLGGTSTLTLDHNGSLILANNSSFIQNSANSAITIGSSNTASSFTIDTTDSGALSAGNPIMEVDWTAGAVNLQLFARTAGLNPISNNDHLIFTGTGQIRATNTLNITTSGVNSNTFLDGDSWDLFTFSSLLPYQFQFSSFNLPTLTSGLFWNTSTLATDGRISVTLVPEPSRILFCAVACTSLLLRRRRSRSIF